MLDQTRWASDFTWTQICKISEQMHAYKAEKDCVIFEEGSTDQSLGIIVEGNVDIVKTDGDETRVLATLHPSHSFGEMSLIDGEPRSAKVVAATDVVMLILNKDSFFELGKTTPALALRLLWKISAMISQRLRRTSGQLVDHLLKENPAPAKEKS
jgi:CRP-like cAMP-binding protein